MSLNGSAPMQPTLIVLSAPSGAGKSTIASMILSNHTNVQLSISYTTRPPRGNEKNGVHYFFVSEDEFSRMAKNNEFLEYAFVFGKYWYGTSKATVEGFLNQGKSVLFDIDVQGAASLKKAFQERCVTFFLLPPSFEELEARLRNRKTDSLEAIETRLKTAKEELKHAPSFDHQVVNRDVNETYTAIKQILIKRNSI